MEPAASEPAASLRIGSAQEMAGAHTRSHLPDGRVVGWYGAPGAIIDAELYDAQPPPHLVERFGADSFWERWTATECAVKREDSAMAVRLAGGGLDWSPHEVVWIRDSPAPGVIVAVLL